ncbi:MAG: GT4 family glycosyltransferase PelF [Lachnospiraceae bacterium]|nr:GT4 family glycosyltransferase PelF [Lachnospiraceae bacterium]
MRICIVAEGCYPYVVGGVSGWINSMIKSFPEHEFVVLSIVSDRSMSGKFQYTLPDNVSEVYEAYLNDDDWGTKPKEGRRTHLTPKQYRALRSVIFNYEPEWYALFDLFQKTAFSIDDILMGADFLHIVQEYYDNNFSQIVFSDFLWTMRSIYMPLFLILKTKVPKADVYHCVATGYAGLLGSMAKYLYGCGLIVSEHGIYTREREEELLKAGWVAGIYKNIWIDQFRKMSQLAYDRADIVTALYGHARELQMELGCKAGKIEITPNGIDVARFENIAGKLPNEYTIDIGAIVRVTPIKEIKTMIRAFAFAKNEVPNLRLWIMGPTDEDEEYAKECYELVEVMEIEDVIFTGRVNVTDYIGKMDFTILTSISEGQPLTILESFAAKKPVIATDVGNCRELIYGEEDDDAGTAGILCHIMNVEEIAHAMTELALNTEKRYAMGEIGYTRVMNHYRIEMMKDKYDDIYKRMRKKVFDPFGENNRVF